MNGGTEHGISPLSVAPRCGIVPSALPTRTVPTEFSRIEWTTRHGPHILTAASAPADTAT